MKVLNNLDLNKNELQNAVIQKLAAAPSNPVKGQEYFNTTDNKKYIYDGSNWKPEINTVDSVNGNTGVVSLNAGDVGALPNSTKYAASLNLTINNTTYVLTAQLKDQDGNNIGSAQTIDLPIESVVVSGSYDSTTKEVVLTLQSGSTIRFSVADLVSGLQTEITSQNKLSSDLVDDTNNSHKFVTASEKTQITTNANDIAGIKDGEEIDSFADVETAFSEIVTQFELIGTEIGDLTNNKMNGIQVNDTDVTQTNHKVNFKAGSNVTLSVSGNEITVNATSSSKKYSVTNPALTQSGGIATWTVTHSLNTTDVIVQIFVVDTKEMILTDTVVTDANTVTVSFVTSSNISAGVYKVVVMG